MYSLKPQNEGNYLKAVTCPMDRGTWQATVYRVPSVGDRHKQTCPKQRIFPRLAIFTTYSFYCSSKMNPKLFEAHY